MQSILCYTCCLEHVFVKHRERQGNVMCSPMQGHSWRGVEIGASCMAAPGRRDSKMNISKEKM
jgi:hypothetical protein